MKTDMRSYYCHFKKMTAVNSEQVVNTDHFGEKRVSIPQGAKEIKKITWEVTTATSKRQQRKKMNKWQILITLEKKEFLFQWELKRETKENWHEKLLPPLQKDDSRKK